MHFTTALISLIASATMVAAKNAVTFWTLDEVERTVYFTGNPTSCEIAPVVCNSASNTTVEFPDGWIGNFYAIVKNEDNHPGMLGEVAFNQWLGKTYFDVSAIVKPEDKHNVKQMWPVQSQSPMSGCETFPCNNCYYLPDDVQTKVTEETELMTTLGSGSTGLNFV